VIDLEGDAATHFFVLFSQEKRSKYI
jgi:hypothetical protein